CRSGPFSSIDRPSGTPSMSTAIGVAGSLAMAWAIRASRASALVPVTRWVGIGSGSATATNQLGRFNAQLLELAVQVGALEAGPFGDPRHAAPFAHQMMFEIGALERVARFAQRQFERYGETRLRRRRGL